MERPSVKPPRGGAEHDTLRARYGVIEQNAPSREAGGSPLGGPSAFDRVRKGVGLALGPVAALGCALACSMAFMLPVATPPNAIVYGSGRVPITHMVRTGLWMNLAACALIPAVLLAIRWVVRV